MRQYLTAAGALTAVFAIAILLLRQQPFIQPYINFCWYSLAFLLGLSVLVYWLTGRGIKRSTESFLKHFGLALGIKFGVSLLYIILFDKLGNFPDSLFIFPFFAMYFAYSTLTVVYLSRLQK